MFKLTCIETKRLELVGVASNRVRQCRERLRLLEHDGRRLECNVKRQQLRRRERRRKERHDGIKVCLRRHDAAEIDVRQMRAVLQQRRQIARLRRRVEHAETETTEPAEMVAMIVDKLDQRPLVKL